MKVKKVTPSGKYTVQMDQLEVDAIGAYEVIKNKLI